MLCVPHLILFPSIELWHVQHIRVVVRPPELVTEEEQFEVRRNK